MTSSKMLGGGFLCDSPAVYSSDSKRVFVAVEGHVKVYDCSSAALVALLTDADSEACKITAILRVPEKEDIVSCDSKGSIKIWNSGESKVMVKLDQGIVRMVASPEGQLFCLTESDANGNAKIFQVNLKKGKAFSVFKVKGTPFLACSSNLFAYGSGGKRVNLWKMKEDPQRKAVVSAELEHSLSCLTFSADESLVLGFQSGHIQVLRGLSKFESLLEACKTQRAYLHWHSDAVLTIVASPTDSHMVSGGHEGVGVMWSVETRKNQFLPRVGGRVLHISVNDEGSCWAISTSENSILLIGSSDFKVSCEIRGLSASAKSEKLALDIKRHPFDPSLCLVQNDNGSLIQVYDPVADKHTGAFEIVRQNIINALPEQKRKLNTTELPHNTIRLTAFSPVTTKVAQSCWMATWEFCEIDNQSSLKIWNIDAATGDYELVSIFDNPHGKSRVTGMAFNEFEGVLELVTVGDNGVWQLWKPSVMSEKAKKAIDRFSWGLIKKESYYDPVFKASFQSVSFSSDGTLMAITMENLVLIYDAQTKEVLQRLPCSSEPLIGAHFLGTTGGLVAYDANHVHVWDLETLEVRWALSVKVDAFACHGGKFAIALKHSNGESTFIAEFGPAKPVPLQTSEHQGVFIDSLFYSATSLKKCFVLLALTTTKHFVPAFPDDFPTVPKVPATLPEPAAPLSGLAKMILEDAGKALPTFANVPPPMPVKPDVKKADLLLSQMPSHALPPMRLLFASFIKLKLDPLQS